jgi:hypothetical protein
MLILYKSDQTWNNWTYDKLNISKQIEYIIYIT